MLPCAFTDRHFFVSRSDQSRVAAGHGTDSPKSSEQDAVDRTKRFSGVQPIRALFVTLTHTRNFADRAPLPVKRDYSISETVMKKLIASIFSLSLLAATAANAQVGVGVNVGPIGAGAHVGGNGIGAGAHVGNVGAGVGIHGHAHHCSSWGWRNHQHYCRRY
jgi:hypothetical protein